MREGDVAKLLDRQDARDRLMDEWKHSPRARMKEQRVIIHDEVLVERKAACAIDQNWRADAIYLLRDLMHICPGLLVRNGHRARSQHVDCATDL
jgi:hypothetical protein